MYDTIFFTLSKEQAPQVDFLAESACALSQVGEHYFGNDADPKVTGYIDNLRVFVSANSLSIKGGSLAKYYYGNNYQTLKRSDTQRAIERLSDELHLPMDKAKVTRLDIGTTFIMKHPADVYFNHLGTLSHSKRLVEPTGIYYSQRDRRLAFYDKNKEQRNKGEDVPELYRNKNVLRYEHRHLQRLPSRLGVPEVTASMLYDKDFYKAVVHRWADTYKDIKKINDIELNTEIMKTKGDLKMAGVLCLVERCGGITQMLSMVDEARKKGELTPKQAFDLRETIQKACQIKEGVVVPNDAIAELSKKVDEAVRFFS